MSKRWTQKDLKKLAKKSAKLNRSYTRQVRSVVSKGPTAITPNAKGVMAGHRPDIRDCKDKQNPKGLYLRSQWEANYARYLMWLMDRGDIARWEFEPDTFWFEEIRRGTRSYLPDFKIWKTLDSEPYYVEVKGRWDAKSLTKMKRMAKYYPAIRIEVVDGPVYRKLKEGLSSVIPNWEQPPHK